MNSRRNGVVSQKSASATPKTPEHIWTPEQEEAIKHLEILNTWPPEKRKLFRDALVLKIAINKGEINRLKAKLKYHDRKLAAA